MERKMRKKIYILGVVMALLTSYASSAQINQKMLIGDWSCQDVERQSSYDFINGKYVNYKKDKIDEKPLIRHYFTQDNNFFMQINDLPATLITSLKQESSYEAKLPDGRVDVIKFQNIYISNDEFETISDVDSSRPQANTRFSVITKSRCTRITPFKYFD